MLATRWHIVVSENLIVSFKLFCCFLLALLLVLTFHWPPFLCSVSHDHYLMFTNPNTHGPGRANLPKIFLVIISICLVASPRAIMTSLSSVLEEGWCAGEQGLTNRPRPLRGPPKQALAASNKNRICCSNSENGTHFSWQENNQYHPRRYHL